jgi:hypothetical protein
VNFIVSPLIQILTNSKWEFPLPHPHQFVLIFVYLLIDFLMISMLIGVRWNNIAVWNKFVWWLTMLKSFFHVFLLHLQSSFQNCLFSSCAHLLIELFLIWVPLIYWVLTWCVISSWHILPFCRINLLLLYCLFAVQKSCKLI